MFRSRRFFLRGVGAGLASWLGFSSWAEASWHRRRQCCPTACVPIGVYTVTAANIQYPPGSATVPGGGFFYCWGFKTGSGSLQYELKVDGVSRSGVFVTPPGSATDKWGMEFELTSGDVGKSATLKLWDSAADPVFTTPLAQVTFTVGGTYVG